MNKAELSEQINAVLGLEEELDFSKMTREDLEKLIQFLANPTNMITLGVKKLRRKVRTELLDKPLKDVLSRDFLGSSLGDILGNREGKGGILGFGVLDKVLGEGKDKGRQS